jgi:hypothetical protein
MQAPRYQSLRQFYRHRRQGCRRASRGQTRRPLSCTATDWIVASGASGSHSPSHLAHQSRQTPAKISVIFQALNLGVAEIKRSDRRKRRLTDVVVWRLICASLKLSAPNR